MRVSAGIFLFIFFISLYPGYSQENINVKNIALEEGLSHNSVLFILKDSQGFMWFATQDGLNRFDGYTFTTYRNIPKDSTSLSHNYVHCIFEDKSGNLWIGTWGGGISIFNRKTGLFKSYRYDSQNPNSLSSNYINSITQGKDSEIWIGTRNGLNRYNEKTDSFKAYLHKAEESNSLSTNDVSAVLAGSSGEVWIATSGGGLNKFDTKSELFKIYKRDKNNPNSISHNIIRVIHEDEKGNLWLGTWGGLNYFDKNTETFKSFKVDKKIKGSISNNRIRAIQEDKKGNLWVGTWGGGLNRFDRKSKTFHTVKLGANNGPAADIITTLHADAEGNIWIGTMNRGVLHFNNNPLPFVTFQSTLYDTATIQGLSNDDVKTFHCDKTGLIWIGTEDGLNRFDPSSSTFTVYKSTDPLENDAGNSMKKGSIGSNFIRSIYEDSKGRFWIGTASGGINLFDRESETFQAFTHTEGDSTSLSSNNIKGLLEDHKNNFWVGTWGGGLNLFDRKRGTSKSYKHDDSRPNSISDNFISTIFEDKSGSLWIGTQNGLNLYLRNSHSFKVFRNNEKTPGSISNNTIYCITEDWQGNLWIGTQQGLNKFNTSKQKFVVYTMKDGLAGDEVFGIVEDQEKNLWISTNKGISKFDPEIISFQNFDIRDRLQSNFFNPGAYCKGIDGKIYFGGIAGFNVFHPDSIHANAYQPSTVITSFKIFNNLEPLPFSHLYNNNQIKLSYEDAFFTIEYAALSFLLPEKNQYKYKLEGFDKDWIIAGTRREATYTNLDGGTYTFYVMGSNNNGIWGPVNTSIKITISPPWWRTTWFRILGSFLLFIFIIIGYQVQGYRIKSKNRFLEAKVFERTHQIEKQKKEIELNHNRLNTLHKEIRQKNEELEKKVSERTRELQERETQLRLITDALPVLISYIDTEQKFRFNNKTYENWFGPIKEEILGKFIWEVIGFEAYNIVKGYIERALKGEFIHFETEIHYKGGRHLFESTFYVPQIEENQVLGFYALTTDISDRKRIEEALAKALKEFENKNKDLIKINADLDNFVYTASHDLRSPISNLEGLQNLMIKKLEGRLDPDEEEIIGMMSKSIIRLKRTIGELGEIARVQKEFLPEQLLSFEEVISEVKADIAPILKESQAEIISHLEVININYPHKHLRSILYNLISNAIKYRAPDRSPKVVINTRKMEDKIQLIVADNGLGLEENQVKKMFKMFKRLHTHVEGSGIGLYMVKRIIENNGGNIEVESEPGVGTTFTINL